MKKLFIIGALICGLFITSCDSAPPTSDQIQTQQQETILKEGTSAIGMPAIKNFTERRLLKMILEMRDQANLTTFTYTFSENTGEKKFFCNSIGFGLPYSTQFTNPSKVEIEVKDLGGGNRVIDGVLPQADPNGLFSPSSAEGTWILCQNPKTKDVSPVYIEPRVIVSPFPLDK